MTRFPRPRGDGPLQGLGRGLPVEVPPPTRGWSPFACAALCAPIGSPAHAGMVPYARERAPYNVGFPRPRGDGPQLRAAHHAL